jgi:hypothetical protein
VTAEVVAFTACRARDVEGHQSLTA